MVNALSVDTSVEWRSVCLHDAPFGQCRRRYTGRVHIQIFRSIPRLPSNTA